MEEISVMSYNSNWPSHLIMNNVMYVIMNNVMYVGYLKM